MGKDKKPPEYADDSSDRPPPYNPYYDQAGGASGVAPPPPPTGFNPPPSHLNQPPPAYQPGPDFIKAQGPPIPQQPDRLLSQQSGIPTHARPATATTVTNVQIHISDEFGPYAQHAVCPKCREYVVTKTKSVTGALTWLSCIGLFMLGCDFGCCLVPCCVDSCRDVQHKCPNCGCRIGKYKRLC
ncbi:lipopolysaccharide-induced tumor necrosis factor-alpha factor homolog [Panonychus citri]|uniref:lipopolysaccharide-induced tumor necrosis factor-alpha factor homolog n=1 Tax=Panonychus citri TaxID=50023 RepID=UPI00230784AF|nr:lipopolysaccharide-induced tumor necrosis factor-alpha factor homolog [Panonychus citri]XP_053210314.1 lipopolysaccharide-induced tumor necrosis factor-alpha factor homolog [Panonychus citri]XP_053210315.1 lipopolysaccharide-induced tumor necrosis factor-alpha factor homolog [Panonychus citri]